MSPNHLPASDRNRWDFWDGSVQKSLQEWDVNKNCNSTVKPGRFSGIYTQIHIQDNPLNHPVVQHLRWDPLSWAWVHKIKFQYFAFQTNWWWPVLATRGEGGRNSILNIVQFRQQNNFAFYGLLQWNRNFFCLYHLGKTCPSSHRNRQKSSFALCAWAKLTKATEYLKDCNTVWNINVLPVTKTRTSD